MSWPDARQLRWVPTARVRCDDGTQLAVEVLGDNHPGPTLVFVHGWTLSSRFWHYQRSLAERYRLVLVDQRDHGESDSGPREHRTIDQLGRDLRAVLGQVCPTRQVVLIGHSMGGMAIMALAAQSPELFGSQVSAVALLRTSARREVQPVTGLRGAPARWWTRQWNTTLATMVSDPVRAEQDRRPGSAVSVAISKWLNLGPLADRRLAWFTEAMSASTPAQAVGDYWLTLDTHDKSTALATLAVVPTLVVVGDRDRITPPSHSRAVAAAVSGARLLELRGAGHCAALEQPNAVNAALRSLVSQAIEAAPAAADRDVTTEAPELVSQ